MCGDFHTSCTKVEEVSRRQESLTSSTVYGSHLIRHFLAQQLLDYDKLRTIFFPLRRFSAAIFHNIIHLRHPITLYGAFNWSVYWTWSDWRDWTMLSVVQRYEKKA